MRKVCSLFLCILLTLSFVACEPTTTTTCDCTPGPTQTQPQEEPKQTTILAVYKHERHDGRIDRITVLSDGSFLWAVYMKDKLSHETKFNDAEELFDYAIQYQNNWDHNKWIKE